MPLELKNISTQRLASLSKENTVFFFPVGVLEDHGEHLPVGLDIFEAKATAYALAKMLETQRPDWTGVLMPDMPLGVDGNTTKIAFGVRSYVLRDWLVDICKSLSRLNFKHFVCISGSISPRQLTVIEDASKLVRNYSSRRRFFSFFRSNKSELVSASSAMALNKEIFSAPFWPTPREHGGKLDTSVALFTNPDLVSENHKELKARPEPGHGWVRLKNRLSKNVYGYWGDAPMHATCDFGEKHISDKVQFLYPKLEAVWDGKVPYWVAFRSWHSILPPNKSFFKAWLLVLVMAIVLFVWLYLNISALL